ncbi:MAG TPA: hypothetical protein VGB42_02875, partial [Candidatus Thermoplasmatota archaeon]
MASSEDGAPGERPRDGHEAYQPGEAPPVTARQAARFYAGLLGHHKWLLAGIFAMGLAIASTSFLSIGLILPLIEAIGNPEGGALEGNPLGFM